MSQQDIGDPTLRLKLGSKRNRKKRDARRRNKDRGRTEHPPNSNSTKVPTVYGCPNNYDRITDSKIDICLRFGKLDDTEKDLVAKYGEARKHCGQDNAKLLYFLDFNEALRIWKWLGKYIIKSKVWNLLGHFYSWHLMIEQIKKLFLLQILIHQNYLSKTVSFFMLSKMLGFGRIEMIPSKPCLLNYKTHITFESVQRDTRIKLTL